MTAILDTPINIVANVLTILFLVFGLVITRNWTIQKWIAWQLARSLNRHGFSEFSFHDAAERTRQISQLERNRVANEMDWLASHLGFEAPNDHSLLSIASQDELSNLASAYDDFASKLNGQAILSTNLIPLVYQSFQLARATATHLHSLTRNVRFPSSTYEGFPLDIPHRGVSIRVHAFPNHHKKLFAFELVVSVRNHLIVPEGASQWGFSSRGYEAVSVLKTSIPERDILTERFSDGMLFDGVLPRLVSWERRRDNATGHQGIHLAIASCSYSSVVLDHYPATRQFSRLASDVKVPVHLMPRGVRESRDVSGSQVGLLTLSAIPITRDGYMVLAERSKHTGSYEGLYNAAISGNLDMSPRKGVEVDLDDLGIPDPRRAIAREAMEELGLQIDHTAVAVTGLATCDAPTELGTHVLFGTVRVRETLEDLSSNLAHSDQVEGRWEIGHNLLGVRIPESDDEFKTVASWLLNSHSLTPHTTVGALAAISSFRQMYREPWMLGTLVSDNPAPGLPRHLTKSVKVV